MSPGLTFIFFVAERQQPLARRDVVELLALQVPVQQRARAGRHDGLGQALAAIAVLVRMHQLADFRAVLGDVGGNVGQAGFHGEAFL
ncbi:MAG: hypothetical protein M5R42_09670 [Rhodocyclaceae bacterium]|nr:hypothetical protein [Rhodocyclaceae bacterium]